MTIRNAALYANPFLLWTNIALRSAEMLWASSQVISHRTSRIMQAHPNYSVSDRREIALMGQEMATSRTAVQYSGRQAKLLGEHATQSAVAATRLSSSVAQIAHRGLQPIHSRATKNAKRLGKR